MIPNSPSNPSPSIPQVHSSLSSRLGGRTMYRGGGVVAGNTQTPIAETNSQPNTRGGFRGSARGRHPNRTLKSGRGGAATIGNNAASGAIYRPPARKFNNVLKNGTPEADFESEDGSTSSPQQSSRFAGIGNFGNKTAQWGVNGKAVSGQVAAFSFLSAAQDQPTSLFQPAVSIPSVLNTSNIIQQTVNYPSALPQHTFPLEEQPQQRPNKFAELQPDRENVRKEYVRLGKMSDGARALKDAITFVGECLDMCPEYERYEREAHNGLDPLERIPGTDFVDHMRAVKRYRRSAAGDPDQMPSDVRPPKILLETLSYLIYDLLGLHGFDKTYTFLRDRQRAIRSDFQLQNYRGPEAVRAFEVMVRYGIMAQHLLSKDAEDVKLKLKQEIDQMNAALKTLIEMYSELGAKGIFFPNEPEFRAYFILVHIWTSEVTVQMERETRPEVFFHPFIQHAVKIQSTVGSRRRSARTTVGFINQFSKFFRLVEKKETTYLMSAICETHFVYIRMAAMRAAIKSYYTIQNKDDTMMDAEELTQLLGFDDGEEVLEYLEFLEIPYEEVNGRIKIQFGKLVVDGKFQNPTIVEFEKVNLSQRQKLNRRIVEHKRESMNLSDVDVVEGKDRLYYNFPGNQSELPQSVVVPPVTRSFPKPIRQNSLSSWNAVPGLPTFQSSSSVLPNSASQSAHFSPKISEPEPTPRLMTTSISIPTSTTPMPVNPSASATTPIPVNPFADVNVQPSQNPKPSFTFKSPSINPEPNLIPSVSFSSSSSTLFPIQTPLTTTSTTNTPNFNLFPTPVQIPTPTTKPTTTLSTESSLLLQQRLAKLNAERQEHENELIVTDVLISLLDSQVEETIIETYESLLATNNLETQKLNDDMSNEIATLIVEETMYETFFELLKEEEWDEIAVEIVEDVVTECITDELGEIGVECEIERMNVEKWFWKWRYSMERSRTEREIDDAKRFKRMRMNQAFEKAKVMNVASIFQGKRNYVKRNRLSFGGSDNQWSRWGDLEGKRKLRMRKIGIEQFVGELGYDGFLKCLVCVNGRDGKDGVMTRWLKSLLRTNNQSVEDGVARYGSNFVEFWGHGIESVETEMRSLVRKSKQVEILIQGVQIADEPRYPLKPNSECACSGPNFAIFSLEVFEGHLSEKTAYWSSQRLRLYSFLSMLPATAKIPILVVFCVSLQMSGEDFEENVKEQLNFRSIIEDGPVLSVEYLVVSLDDEESDKTTQLVRENFMEKLVWLITSSPKEPNLKTGIFKDFVEMRSAKNLSYAVWRISEFFPTKTFALDLAVHQLCLNTILRLFNITLDAVCAILSHQDLSSLAWPSREHPISTKITTPIPLDWNTQINLSQKAFYIERYKVDDLPPYPHSDGADSETLVRAYDYWIESLMEMCQQPSVWATTESFESLSLEVRRTCKAFTSNVDESLRFPIHKILESLSSTLCTCLAAHLSSIPELENSPYFIQHSESATDAVRDAFTVEILRLEQSLNELKSRKKRKVLYDRDISLKRNKLENEITEYEDIGSGEEVVYEEEFSPILPLQNGYREEYNDETDAFDGIEMDENMDDVISYVSDDNEIDMTYYSTSSENVKNLAKELRSLINSAKKDLEVDILEN